MEKSINIVIWSVSIAILGAAAVFLNGLFLPVLF